MVNVSMLTLTDLRIKAKKEQVVETTCVATVHNSP
jgi:hypothetical protein